MLISIYLFSPVSGQSSELHKNTHGHGNTPSCSSELEFPRVNLLPIGFICSSDDKVLMSMFPVKVTTDYDVRKHQKCTQLLQSLNETILKLMETPDAFMIVCPKRVQLRVSWRDSHCPKWNKHPCLHKNITTLRKR